jgi:hypothetical protein
LIFSIFAAGQSHNRRLILKDGSYQSVTDYKVEGNRVHYFSAERYAWEDIPNDLIDWDATNKYNANPVKNDTSRQARDAAEEEATEDAKSESQAPTVAPRLRLPDAEAGGVYLLDKFQDRLELAEIVQNGVDVGQATRKDALRVALGGAHKSFQLPGAHARVQAHTTTPAIFMCVESGEKGANLSDHYRMVRVESDSKKNTRSVGTLTIKTSGKTTESQNFLPVSATLVNGGPWVKVTADGPLEPGEYAVIEMLGDQMNLYVWDFGVNAAAPENVNVTLPGNP